MPTPSRKVKSPPSKSKSRSRSRSRSRGRSGRSTSKSPARTKSKSPSRTQSKSPSRASRSRERSTRTEVKKEIVVTPSRQSRRISELVEKEKKVSSRIAEQIKSEVRNNMSDKKEKEEKPAAKTKNMEFGGTVGAFFTILLLPVVMYYINMACNKTKCTIMELPKFPKNPWILFDVEATLIFFGWLGFQAALYMLPIGQIAEGQPLRAGGKRLKYRCNGFIAFLISVLAFAAAVYFKVPLVKMVHGKFYRIMTTAILFSFILSICLYIKAKSVPKSQLAAGGNTGSVIYDFFIGHELNPRIFNFDLKFFCELRPGLIGWVMLNFIFVLKAYEDTGSFPPALTLVTAFQTLYVADALWHEEAILTTMDIIHDGFGYMLAFGDLAWVPFLYCLQPRFLLDHDPKLQWYCLATIALLNVFGYMLFRGANSQKNNFRKNPYNPSVANLETIPTSSGKRLLVGGFWGMCRKPNYLGDLMMALAWSLTCGWSIIPYFYPIYFLILLIHRERRDSEQCAKKYGSSWKRYCERVPYRIIPYVY